ncbi:ketosteroid isomerase-related protein [Deinococcus arenicola]|uniref:Nuclear transport factor 2 family protein n=1 Tax=Deinococcus arenicola TaxID=2994950 RepID=A0ABU4DML8_9DEIO|nr:ketosteroid isomerase-related protein [Deinococcus sp. ZS9-10]MDV6373603.1 nuclear transport factor 2 family protein [Deinococcus sp. ZS9-10]
MTSPSSSSRPVADAATPQVRTHELITRYYAAFNDNDPAGMLELLSGDVQHDINEGATQMGKGAFETFLTHMDTHYREQARNLTVMVSADGLRAAAEFVIHGEYLKTDEGLPPAKGQKYALPVGAFFEVHGGQITRVTNYYNLQDWTRQVGG